MTISRQTFNQVRNILRELDERITSARQQRTGDSEGPADRKPMDGPSSPSGTNDPAGMPPGRRSA